MILERVNMRITFSRAVLIVKYCCSDVFNSNIKMDIETVDVYSVEFR